MCMVWEGWGRGKDTCNTESWDLSNQSLQYQSQNLPQCSRRFHTHRNFCYLRFWEIGVVSGRMNPVSMIEPMLGELPILYVGQHIPNKLWFQNQERPTLDVLLRNQHICHFHFLSSLFRLCLWVYHKFWALPYPPYFLLFRSPQTANTLILDVRFGKQCNFEYV